MDVEGGKHELGAVQVRRCDCWLRVPLDLDVPFMICMQVCTMQALCSYMPVLTRPVTLSSISLSLRPKKAMSVYVWRSPIRQHEAIPDNDSCFSFPYSISASLASVQPT